METRKQGSWFKMPGLYNKREIEQIKEPDREYRQEPRGTDAWGREVFVLYYRPKQQGGGE